jgi:molybdenum cofactor cytidylyltransferase
MIWAVILAAGESRRLGGAKLLLPYGRTTIIETVINKVTSSKVERTLVVLGSHWRTLKELIKKYPVVTAVNPRFKQGMLSSIQRGISALPRNCRAAVVVLGDQPDVRPGVINLLLADYRREGKGIVVPVYGQNRGHPLLVDLKFRNEIAGLNPEVGLRDLLQKHPQDILEVRVPRSSVLLDIDTPEDYRKAKKIKEKD